MLVKPQTVISWHGEGFRLYWKWKSRRRIGRPGVSKEIRDLIRNTSSANVLWGVPRLHAELLKLGIEVSQATVAKHMVKHRKPPSQAWRSFLENHVKQSVSVDFFVVPTLSFRILYVFLVLAHERRCVVHFSMTEHPIWVSPLRSRGSVGSIIATSDARPDRTPHSPRQETSH